MRSLMALARWVTIGLVFFAPLTSLTVWNLTRSDRIPEARRAYTRGDFRASLREALDHLHRRPWSRDASLLAALSLSRLDFADESEPYYRQAGPLSLDESHYRAYGLVRANHREMAIRAYRDLLERWPDDVLAMRRLAAVYITQKDDAEVLKLAEQLIAVPGGAAIGYTLRGVIHQNDKNWIEAAAAFERVLDLDPQLKLMPLPRSLFWTDLTSDLMRIGRVDDARRHLSKAIDQSPNAELLIFLGLAHDRAGAIEEAEATFRRAVEIDPSLSQPYLQLGRIEQRRQHLDEALKYLLKAEQISPRDYDTIYTISLVYRQLGRNDLADRFLSRAEVLRAKPPSSATTAQGSLPRYAL
jgi:tetratricopeptide (TPR) repeat protein